ncbi:MAG: FKBP-type 22 kDa peptidyl-prolyl cis-trans isomerase [Planctomycetota bacterium]|jgi:FKBP-type peptidyl-prolyl cis-trans isomerase
MKVCVRTLSALGLSMVFGWASIAAVAQESLPPVKKGTQGTSKAGSTPSTKSPANTKSANPPQTERPAEREASPKNGGTTGPATKSAPATKAPAENVTGQNKLKPLTPAIKEQVSYAIGLDLGARFKSEGEDVNLDLIIKGLKDGYADAKLAYTEDQLRSAMEIFQQHMQVKAEEQLKKFAADNVAFLETNKKKAGVKTTKSGLQYQVLKSGSGKSPKTGDWIRANYHGTLIDGNIFESTIGEGGEPVEIAVEDTIPGWTEALALMKTGDKWRLFIPSTLAYGEQGNGPVPPHATLIFDLELLDIVKPPKEEKEAKSNQLLK